MEDTSLANLKIAILATDMFEEIELTEPREALEAAGATTEIIAPNGPEIIAAQHFDKSTFYQVDRLLSEADPQEYDGVLLPGGALNADNLRVEPAAQAFVRHMDSEGKPMAVICHAPWLLVSAGLVNGRTLTSYHTLADDITNAGGHWLDEAVVRDDNWVTSRQPSDIPAFNEAILDLFATARETMVQSITDMPEPVFREQLGNTEDDEKV